MEAAGVWAAVGTGCVPEAQEGAPSKAAKDGLPEVSATFSLQSRSSMQQGDLDGARRLGRLAGMLSITFIILGVVIIIVAVTVNFAGEAQPHSSLLSVRTVEGGGPAPRDRGAGGEKGKSMCGPQPFPLTQGKQPSPLQGLPEWGWLSDFLMPGEEITRKGRGKSTCPGVRGYEL